MRVFNTTVAAIAALSLITPAVRGQVQIFGGPEDDRRSSTIVMFGEVPPRCRRRPKPGINLHAEMTAEAGGFRLRLGREVETIRARDRRDRAGQHPEKPCARVRHTQARRRHDATTTWSDRVWLNGSRSNPP